jgi:hypothetical protein
MRRAKVPPATAQRAIVVVPSGETRYTAHDSCVAHGNHQLRGAGGCPRPLLPSLRGPLLKDGCLEQEVDSNG